MHALARAACLASVVGSTFSQEPAVLFPASAATCAAAGDLDGDGDPDLLIGREGEPLALLVGDGKGAFAPAEAAFGKPEGRIRAIALLDADGDSDLDVLVGGVDALTRLWSNEGELRFVDTSSRLPETKLWTTAIATGDMDGDGDTDAVVGAFGGPPLLFRNERTRFELVDGAFAASLRSATALALADLDGDGDLDVVLGQNPDATGRGGRNRAAKNEGKGKFTDATDAWMPTAQLHTGGIALAELGGEGKLVLVCANRGAKPKEGARSGVHRRGDGGRFLASSRERFDGAPAVSQALALGDVDGDGDVDILFGNDGPDALYLNDGSAVFAAGAFPAGDDDTRAVLLLDVDGDRDLDVVTVNHGAPARLFVNGGAGRFGSQPVREPDSGTAPAPVPAPTAVAAGKYASRGLAQATVREPAVRQAIASALRFLADHQGTDGAFRTATFVGGAFGDPAVPATHDVGVTALVLLCFLAESSHPGGGFYAENVLDGLDWLRAQQQADGHMGPGDGDHGIYDHAIATLALAEACALSGDAGLRAPLERALTHLEGRRNPDGGFRYQPGTAPSDTSVTAWCALAQIAGNDVGIPMAAGGAARTLAFLRSMTDEVTGRTGYSDKGGRSARVAGETERDYPTAKSEALTGAALFVRLALGEDPAEHADLRAGLAVLAAAPPRLEPEGYFDPYGWFHGAHALAQLGGDEWVQWRKSLHTALLARQHAKGNLVGSYDPKEPWGATGGRFASTALATLALQAEYRFAKLVDPRWRRRVK